MSGQRTLFQTWGAPVPSATGHLNDTGKKPAGKRKPTTKTATGKSKKRANDIPLPPRNSLWAGSGHGTSPHCEMGSVDADEDDDLMLVAVYEAEKSLQNVSSTTDDNANAKQTFLTCPTSTTSSSSTCSIELPGFDRSSAEVWIYPTNYPIRDYQLKISEKALFQNTLVCLPTGLGKTFIASVVMYNFYRWYPAGKIVFMAPTKPLVAQQIEACYKVMGIPQGHMAELTGSIQAQARRELWKSRRVFFLTPQVMVNDLSRETCPASQVKCVVIDEAHKALGNHAYCQVIRELGNKAQQFRILALSATPGGDVTAVQNVISNLLIAHIELRSEESPDIQAHSHQRSLEKVVVPLGDMLSGYQARYLQLLEKFTGRLTLMGVLSHRDLRNLTKYQLILARDQFRKNPPPRVLGAQQGVLEGDFALCISLYHGYELLLQMGLRSLFLFVQGIMDGTKEMARARNELQRAGDFMDLYKEMEALFMKPSAGPGEPFMYSHPKLQKLEDVVVQHFQMWAESTGPGEGSSSEGGAKSASTRVMIFSSFRESVQEIAAMLNRHLPLIRVMTFMGQASAGKGVRGFTQKEQLEVVRRFREGGFNTLVSTCVGEEGLDIGDVDLIVCFDAQKSPIRLVQRMGRTGRHRQGRIVVILAEGREERTYNQSQMNKRSVYKSIMGKKHSFHMFPHSPRMLPEGVSPTLHKMFITCGQFEHRETGRRSSKGRRSIAEAQESFLTRGHCENIREDGFLTPKEFSLWSSTLRLGADEPQPVLSHSHFLSFPNDALPEEQGTEAQSRELSLWEWRYWQNRPFPTHRVNHSDRCQHFIHVMELIDSMRQEEEGSCAYEAELMTFLRKEDVVGHRGAFQPHTDTNSKEHRASLAGCKRKSSSIEDVDMDFIVSGGKAPKLQTPVVTPELPWTSIKEKTPLEKDSGGYEALSQTHQSDKMVPDIDMESDGCIVIPDGSEEEEVRSLTDPHSPGSHSSEERSFLGPFSSDAGYSSQPEEPCPELSSMFYLPQWDVCPKLQHLPGTQEKVRALLADVKDFLSRPPLPSSDLDSLPDPKPELKEGQAPPEPEEWGGLFQVNFCLDVEDEEKFGDSLSPDHDSENLPPDILAKEKSMSGDGPTEPLSNGHSSPGWDEVFDDVKDAQGLPGGASAFSPKQSMELPPFVIEVPVPSVLADESMDLFGDDDDFLGVSMPESPCDQAPRHTLEAPSEDADNSRPKRNEEVSRLSSAGAGQKPREDTEDFDCSQELFSVNFDLGYSLEDSDEGEETGTGARTEEVSHHSAALTHSRTKGHSLVPPRDIVPSPAHSRDHHQGCVSTPLAVNTGRRNCSPLTSKVASMSPIVRRLHGASHLPTTSGGVASRSPSGAAGQPGLPASKHCRATSEGQSPRAQGGLLSSRRLLLQMGSSFCENGPVNPPAGLGCSDSEEEMVVRGRGRRGKSNPFASPATKAWSDVDSPVPVTRKRRAALITSEESGNEQLSDQDFQDTSTRFSKVPRPRDPPAPHGRAKKAVRRGAREFLDEEAELSEEGGAVSSDEEEEEGQDHSLAGFVVDHTQLSQGLNDSEMYGVYLKSVRSPAFSSKYRMAYRPRHNIDIFSQVPEQDESYGEDSFVVHGSEVEELESSEEEGPEEEELILEESVREGRRMYPTRRRAQLRRARAREGPRDPLPQPADKTKRSRIIRRDDSSEEEEEEVARKKMGKDEDLVIPCRPAQTSPFRPPQGMPPSRVGKAAFGHRVAEEVSLKDRCRQRLNPQVSVSEALDQPMLIPTQSQPTRPQVREQNETYEEDCFVLQDSEVEESETKEERGVGKAMLEESVIIRRKHKHPWIVPLGDSSEEEQEEFGRKERGKAEDLILPSRPAQMSPTRSPLGVPPSSLGKASLGHRGAEEVSLKDRCRQRLNPQVSVSEALDQPMLIPTQSQPTRPQPDGIAPFPNQCESRVEPCFVEAVSPGEPRPPCVLVDSSLSVAGPEVVSCLRAQTGVAVQLCPMGVCHFIVSSRMAVERQTQAEGLTDRMRGLLGLFDRVCLILEKPHTLTGYGSLFSLIRAGVRLMFSGGPGETAALLAELALSEQRKGQAIAVPTEVGGHHWQALDFYLTLPGVSYVTALNMCHGFRSVGHLVGSSIEGLMTGACVSRSRAEEIYHFLQHICNTNMLPEPAP
ncbi:Fanconi anemia group M protein isoform X2 [Conger conger]|uniref:Fanconi anemia group M protein isoform X2 n=1 Tax=Conger conger TaxID=82655 RepID=UPI002A5A6564|nr:Fanconi anemia group M protein isoform X2 [Conger conger]